MGIGSDGDVRASSQGPNDDWQYTIGIRFFQSKPDAGSFDKVNEWPRDRPLPPVLLQAARNLLNLSQADLRVAASVSKKMINDVENGFLAPSAALDGRLREALEREGARFVQDGDRIGVIATSRRSEVAARSRSPRLNETPQEAVFVAPSPRPRGRPRKPA